MFVAATHSERCQAHQWAPLHTFQVEGPFWSPDSKLRFLYLPKADIQLQPSTLLTWRSYFLNVDIYCNKRSFKRARNATRHRKKYNPLNLWQKSMKTTQLLSAFSCLHIWMCTAKTSNHWADTLCSTLLNTPEALQLMEMSQKNNNSLIYMVRRTVQEQKSNVSLFHPNYPKQNIFTARTLLFFSSL